MTPASQPTLVQPLRLTEAEISPIELSIVMPCLNEAETLETCIRKAQDALREHGIAGEVVIADNGSTDGSQALATRLDARVVNVKEKGYGNALMGILLALTGAAFGIWSVRIPF